VLSVRNVAAFYGDVQALKDVSLDVPEGKIVALLGPNAAGKSTTLRVISGMVPVRSGHVTLDGKGIENQRAYRIVEEGVIHVPEGRGLFGTLTVRENLELGAYPSRARTFIYESLEQVFSLFPRLKERERQIAGSLSGGEQQMCALARGLMARPRIFMIDEMSMGLAPLLVQSMFQTVQQIARSGLTILLVEQQIHRALQVADFAYILEKGCTVLSGTAHAMSKNVHVKEVYLGM
jgi:branched-chain amino acid transport system ATP-binding protein